MICSNNSRETTVVHITDRAVDELQDRLAGKHVPGRHCFRIAEKAGECYLHVDIPMPGDVVFENDGRILLVMDKRSAKACAGCIIHYDDQRAVFRFVLPPEDH